MVKLAAPVPLLGSPLTVPDHCVFESIEIVYVVVEDPENAVKLLKVLSQ